MPWTAIGVRVFVHDHSAAYAVDRYRSSWQVQDCLNLVWAADTMKTLPCVREPRRIFEEEMRTRAIRNHALSRERNEVDVLPRNSEKLGLFALV
jgi:hypothetical protein